MYGSPVRIPVPDVDRTDYLLIVGGNPVVSQGSIMTAPGIADRLRAIRARGGKLVVIDPRRTETAALADEHHFVTPGTDAALLLAMAQVLYMLGDIDKAREHKAKVIELAPPENKGSYTNWMEELERKAIEKKEAAGAK